jgi:hypothetical protein
MDDNPNESQEDTDYTPSEGAGEEKKGASESKAAPANPEARSGVRNFFVDHTPPPLTISSSSVIIETDEPFVSRDNLGSASHSHRHKLSAGRSVEGLRILDDAGNTIYLDGQAAKSSIKVWWNKEMATEQILVDGNSFTIEADADLGAGVAITHPPANSAVQRIRQYTHPSTNGKGIEKVEVVKGGATVFSRTGRLEMVLIWDDTE